MSTPVVIGVDVGGTKISSAIATAAGSILFDSTTATDPAGGLAVVDQISRQVDELCSAVGIPAADVAATGIGVAGVLDRGGLVTNAPNLGLDGHELTLAIDARLSHAVVVDNDVNAAALAEHRHGHGRSVTDLAFIAVGTGIGMGLIVGGSVVRGSRGAAGEIGHLPFGTDLLDPHNHRRGPLEEAVSGAAIAARYREQSGVSLSVPEIFELAEAGDSAASTVLDHEAALLARAIVAVVAVIDPAMVILGGGVGSRPVLVDLVQRWLRRLGDPTIDIRLSQLGPQATMIGAVELARDAARIPRVRESLT
jgi:predicted NBD/HSP70 family sugar kinase